MGRNNDATESSALSSRAAIDRYRSAVGIPSKVRGVVPAANGEHSPPQPGRQLGAHAHIRGKLTLVLNSPLEAQHGN